MNSQEIMLIKELHGHSGCNLWLYQSGNDIFLRKDAGAISYNDRLRKQCFKQKCFNLNSVKTPKVFR